MIRDEPTMTVCPGLSPTCDRIFDQRSPVSLWEGMYPFPRTRISQPAITTSASTAASRPEPAQRPRGTALWKTKSELEVDERIIRSLAEDDENQHTAPD